MNRIDLESVKAEAWDEGAAAFRDANPVSFVWSTRTCAWEDPRANPYRSES